MKYLKHFMKWLNYKNKIMIKLLHVNDYTLNTADFVPLLNSPIVEEFEQNIADYVGPKYAVSLNSATSAIFL